MNFNKILSIKLDIIKALVAKMQALLLLLTSLFCIVVVCFSISLLNSWDKTPPPPKETAVLEESIPGLKKGEYSVPRTLTSSLSLDKLGIGKTPFKKTFDYAPDKNAGIYKSHSDGSKVVYLTFDDGPTTNITPQVLDILDTYNVPATFFVLGQMVDKNPDILKETVRRGHTIATHGYSHNYKKIYSSTDAFMSDLEEGQTAIRTVLGDTYKNKIFRFPGGGHGSGKDKFKSTLNENQYYYYDWNALTDDSAGNKEPGSQVQRLIATSSGKGPLVVLMHDSAAMKSTPKALPKIIEYYINNGYEFKTISDYTYAE